MPDDAPEPERAEPVLPGSSPRGMVDADDFLAFTERLRAAHHRVDEAKVSDERRARWQRRLLAITDAARADLDRAEEQLGRFEADLDRRLDD